MQSKKPVSSSDAQTNNNAGSPEKQTLLRKFKLRKWAKWTGIGVLTPTVALTALLSVGIDVDLTPHKTRISQWLTDTLARETRIEGDIRLALSFSPEIQLEAISVANTEAFQWQPLLQSGKLNARVNLLPLLTGTLAVDYLELEDIQVQLGKDADGHANWLLGNGIAAAQPVSQPASQTTPDSTSAGLHLTLSDKISAKNISLIYQDRQENLFYDSYLETLSLNQDDSAWQLLAQGAVMGQAYQLDLRGDLLQLLNQQQGRLQVNGELAGASLTVDADIVPWHSGDSQADIRLHWRDTGPVTALLGLDVKPAAPLTVTASLKGSSERLAINDLNIDSPVTQGQGFLAVTLGDHTTIDGELTVPLIDLRPWLAPEPEPMMRAYASAPQQSPLQRALEQWLVNTSTRLDLNIHEVKGLGTSVENLSLSVNGKDGLLSAPMTADIAEVPFRGQATLDATDWTSTLAITLGADNSPLGEMAQWLTGIPHASGTLKHAALSVDTQGTKLSEWLDNAKVGLAIDEALVKWGESASFNIASARLEAGMNLPFSSTLDGQLMGLPTRIQAQGGTLGDVLAERDWPAQLEINSPAVTVRADGLLKQSRWRDGSWLNLNVNSPDAARLSPWLGTQSQISGPVRFSGKMDYRDGWINLAMPDLTLLKSRGNVNLRWKPDEQRPFLALDARFRQLDFTQFGQFINDDSLPEVEQTVPTQGVNLDVPLLGEAMVIADADLNVSVDTLKWANQKMDALSFSGKVRNGRMAAAPIQARYAGSLYKGDIAFGINAANIDAQLNLAVNNPDIGTILHQFNITDSFDMHLAQARLAVSLEGRTVLELMEHAQVSAELSGGRASIADSYTGKALAVKLDRGHFVTGPDTQTRLTLSGMAAGQVASFSLDSLSLKAVNDGREKLPVTVRASLGDMAFNARSHLALPINPRDLSLTFDASLPNLDRLEPFTSIDMPPYGPVNVTAQLDLDAVGYHLRDLLVQVNKSSLTGQGAFLPLLKAGSRPRLELALKAPFIQLDDFKVGDWAAWAKAGVPVTEKDTAQQTAAKGKTSNTSATEDNEGTAMTTPFISPEGLDKFNAQFNLNVGEVRSGKDWLGAGQLAWTLENGLFTLKPMFVQLPGGNIQLDSQIKAKDEMFDIRLNGNIDNFDYGILARRLAPDSGMYGKLSTQFRLSSLANSPDTLMNNASGHIGVAAWPKQLEADLIDLWAVSLTDAIIPNFTNNDPSVLNCVAAAIDVNQGALKQKEMLLDTSRIQVQGEFDASYANRDFSLFLRPQSKRAQIFSLQTPIKVYGKFEKFDFSVPLSAILETSVRFTTSPVISPIRWLVEKPLPADGSQQCEQIWQHYNS